MTLLLTGPMSPLDLFAVLLFAVLFVVVVGVVFWAVKKLCVAFEIGEPIKTIVTVAIVLISVFALLYFIISNVTPWHL
jgi:hypothetical protein